MKPKTVAGYLAAAPADKRAALRSLRRTIKAAAPRAIEAISYGIVGFKLGGRRLVYLGYAKAHCAIYGVGKGTIRFTGEIPTRLVTKLVKARVAQLKPGPARTTAGR